MVEWGILTKDSWTIIDENIAIKKIDKSVFASKQTGIPQEIKWFFNMEGLVLGDKIEIVLKFKEFSYDGILVMTKSPTIARAKMTWRSDLGRKLEKAFEEEAQILLEDKNYQAKGKLIFIKEDDETYTLNVSK